MSRQVIQNGALANDGTGESFRSASTKSNQNFGELYKFVGNDSDVLPDRHSLFRNQLIDSATALPSANDYYVFTNDSDTSTILSDGVYRGEEKTFTNRGAGTVTITPNNFAHGTSFALAQNEACGAIWDSASWFIHQNYSVVTIT